MIVSKSSLELDDIHLNLTAGEQTVNILRGVTLSIGRGETVSVTGPSGSGKTTMLMVMAGLTRPTSGTVRVDGVDLLALDEDGLARFRRGRVGIVFQAFHLAPTMTALENTALPLEFAGAADAMDRARESLALVGLEGRENHYPSQLSGGEQQRVAIARAFAPGPSILLADEPTGNLDGDTGRRVMDLLFAMQARQNATLVMVTHDRELAGRASRAVFMREGRVFGTDSGRASEGS